MASNIFSRLAPQGQHPQRSFYEELRGRRRGDALDVEDHAAIALDEENLNHPFHDDDLDPDTLAVESSRVTIEHEDGDNDVPASLLVEPHEHETLLRRGEPRAKARSSRSGAVPGNATRRTRAQWETTQNQQRLHHDDGVGGPLDRARPATVMAQVASGSAKQKAMWRWVNVSNLDNFITDVYDYYQGDGLWCILLERLLHLVYVHDCSCF